MMFECADRKGIDRRDALLSGGSLLVASALMGEALAAVTSKPANAQQYAATLPALPSDQIGDVATSAYVYAYPLILMELTRRLGTNVADTRQFARAPMNQLRMCRRFLTPPSQTARRRQSLVAFVWIWSIASLTEKLAALARGGKSLKLSSHFATKACAGTSMNIRCADQSP